MIFVRWIVFIDVARQNQGDQYLPSSLKQEILVIIRQISFAKSTAIVIADLTRVIKNMLLFKGMLASMTWPWRLWSPCMSGFVSRGYTSLSFTD